MEVQSNVWIKTTNDEDWSRGVIHEIKSTGRINKSACTEAQFSVQLQDSNGVVVAGI